MKVKSIRITEVFITCDYCDWSSTDHRRRAKDAIAGFRKDGWRTIKGKNACPDCANELKETKNGTANI